MLIIRYARKLHAVPLCRLNITFWEYTSWSFGSYARCNKQLLHGLQETLNRLTITFGCIRMHIVPNCYSFTAKQPVISGRLESKGKAKDKTVCGYCRSSDVCRESDRSG